MSFVRDCEHWELLGEMQSHSGLLRKSCMKYTVYLACVVGLGFVSIDAAENIQQPAQQESFCTRMRARLASCVASPRALKQSLAASVFVCATWSGIMLPHGGVACMVYFPVGLGSLSGIESYRIMKGCPPIPYKFIVGIGSLASIGAWAGSKVGMDLGADPETAGVSGLAASLVSAVLGGIWAKWQHEQERRELEEALLGQEEQV